MTDVPSDNPFWTFSLRLYSRDGVAAACLALQERYGIDVNMLLYCVWLGAERGVLLSEADAARIVENVNRWHDEVVRPLRALRVRLKDDAHGAPKAMADTLRNEIKRTELDAERIEQQLLFTQIWSDALSATRSTSTAGENVLAYLKSLRIRPDTDDESRVGNILAGLET